MKIKSSNSYLIAFPMDGTLKGKNKFCKEMNRDNDVPTKVVFHI